MKNKMKRRMIVVGGVVVLVVILVLAVVAGGSAARSVTVAQLADGQYDGQKVQVTGQVAAGTYSLDADKVTFNIYDSAADPAAKTQITVVYQGAVSSTFGNDVTAIVTGVYENGILECITLVTKCPSKYESGTDALGVSQLLEYGDSVYDKTVRIRGTVVPGSLAAVGGAERFRLADSADTAVEMSIDFDGAIPDAVTDGTALVVTGSLTADGVFHATDVALEA